MSDNVHINWGYCADWLATRAQLNFLGVTLYGNFCDVRGDAAKIKRQIESRGFKVTREVFNDPLGARPLLRVQDGEARVCAQCSHSWNEHIKQKNGAYACVHYGCGCRDVVMP